MYHQLRWIFIESAQAGGGQAVGHQSVQFFIFNCNPHPHARPGGGHKVHFIIAGKGIGPERGL